MNEGNIVDYISRNLDKTLRDLQAGILKEFSMSKSLKWISQQKKSILNGQNEAVLSGSIAEVTEKVIEKAKSASLAQAATSWWEMAHQIADEVVVKAISLARNYPNNKYYDKTKHIIDVKSFIQDAIRFYVQYEDKIDDLVERAEHAEAVAEIVTEMYKPQAQYIALVKHYILFIIKMQELNAKGYKVPQFVLEEVEKLFNQTYQHLELLTVKVREKVWEQ